MHVCLQVQKKLAYVALCSLNTSHQIPILCANAGLRRVQVSPRQLDFHDAGSPVSRGQGQS